MTQPETRGTHLYVADERNEAPFTVQRYDRLPVAEGA